jgi:hypothetical protein
MEEKMEALNELILNEKVAREMWAERYEKESKDHTTSNTEMLMVKS